MDFVHLHNHSDYSLLDGAQTVQSLVRRVKELGMSAVALTEHGNLFSAVNFYSIALKEGIKPIIGCEMYVSQGSRFDRKTREQGGGYYHLLLLAKNNTGFKNLIKLVSKAYTEGFYHRPRIDWELLTKYHEGLIATSACIKGKVPDLAIRGEFEKALQAAREFAELFEGRFYLEVQNHQLPEELQWYQAARRISAMTGIPCVLTNDTHYTLPEHWEAHECICVSVPVRSSRTPIACVTSPMSTGSSRPPKWRNSFPMRLIYWRIPCALPSNAKLRSIANITIYPNFRSQKRPVWQRPMIISLNSSKMASANAIQK